MQAAARDDIHPGRINERRRAASRGEAELAADEVAAAVPPYAEDVLPRSCGTAADLMRKCCETRPSSEHAPSQQGGRGYSADLGARGSAHDGRTGAVLAQVIGEGDAELRWVGSPSS